MLFLVCKCFGANRVFPARRPKSSFIMMQWVLPLGLACVMLGTPAQLTACVDDSQCTTGYYCPADEHACRECLRCQDLSREPPAPPVSCIRSVVDCGSCFKGLVDDLLGEVGACTEPEGAGAALPAYVIVIIVICLLLFALVVVALVYILRHKDTFKILASTRTSVQAPAPSAPQPPPPPYHVAARYEPVRPNSPADAPAHYHDEEEGSQPLVKRAASSRGMGARESAGSQAARVYNNPAYVRNAQPPPSYDAALSDESEHEAAFEPHDEDTVPSAWTPAPAPPQDTTEATPAIANEDKNSSSLALRRPSRSDAVSPPPKMIRLSEDSNNNREQGESSGAAAAPSVVINVLNVNSLHQLNDVTLH